MERPVEEKKVEQIVEKIPDKLLNPIMDAEKVKRQLTQQFLQISFQLASIEKKKQDLFDKLQNNGTSIGNKIQRAFDKMKLNKRKEIRWQFNIKESAFTGVERPTPKKPDVK